jgi:hypothetical protein
MSFLRTNYAPVAAYTVNNPGMFYVINPGEQ